MSRRPGFTAEASLCGGRGAYYESAADFRSGLRRVASARLLGLALESSRDECWVQYGSCNPPGGGVSTVTHPPRFRQICTGGNERAYKEVCRSAAGKPLLTDLGCERCA
jgi:hypothetical protein